MASCSRVRSSAWRSYSSICGVRVPRTTGGEEVDMMELAREKMLGRERMVLGLDSNLLG
jgi:hypothetical protein